MDTVRHEQRLVLKCDAMVIAESGESFLGDLVDISAGGAGVETENALAERTKVSLLIDPNAIPGQDGETGLPSLKGVVAWVRRLTGSSSKKFRLGVAFFPLADDVENRILGAIAAGTGSFPAGPPPTLATTVRGRSVLLHFATMQLDAGRFNEALETAEAALRFEPHNKPLRALCYRIKSEQSLAKGERDNARNELAKALNVNGGTDKSLAALSARIDPVVKPPTSGIFGRLFRK